MADLQRYASMVSRRSLLGGVTAAGGLTLAGNLGPRGLGGAGSAAHAASRDWSAAAEDVRAELLRAWDSYKRHAWGHDLLLPRSASYREFYADGHPVGLTILESLDTLYLMEADDELDRALEWIDESLDFDIDAEFKVFEAVIRLVGGLLSGYHATGEEMLLEKCRDITDRLMPAYEKSPTGIPYRYVNLRTGAVSGRDNVLAEIGTNITEFGDLSQLVGDDTYYRASKEAYRAVIERRSELDLLGTGLNAETGEWTDDTSSINPPVDSFYEYLWEGAALFRDHDLKRWYRKLTHAILRHSGERYQGDLWFKRIDMDTGELIDRHQSELGSFYAGLLGQSGYSRLGRAYHDSWASILERWELLPASIDYGTMKVLSAGNYLRPEYVDSAFMLWLVSGEELYRERAYDYYQRQKHHCRVENAWTVATDVTTSPMKLGDLTSGYWWSEQMKYWYLMFTDCPRFDYRDNYLTTEGNVLRGLKH